MALQRSADRGCGCWGLQASELLRRNRPSMSFFITSAGPGKGADLGGLSGADAHCQQLAQARAGAKTWRAYLSQSATGGECA